ncbi:MAG: acetate--CoA ligase [Thermoplasmata archaeon]|nr:acetate--CoA ligase [Thermoplasmata archaeon]
MPPGWESEPLPTMSHISPGIERVLEINRRALADPDEFWGKVASELYFAQRVGPAFERMDDPPFGRWFPRWKTNLSYNCLDRWIGTDLQHKVALHWEGEPGDRRTFTYLQLWKEVNRFASVLQDLGVGEGDRVTIYLPMIPEAIIAMLATVRLGAVHSVVFGGFATQALADRINDSKSKVLVTADGGWRRGKIVDLKGLVDPALLQTPTIERVVVVKRTGQPVEMDADRDRWYHEVAPTKETKVAPVMVEGPHPSFLLYTSGTTGRPKGACHSTAGYMVWLYYTTQAVFDLSPKDLFWCTADIGWVTGHSYITYGPALRGGTMLMYEGAPDFPSPDRWWELIERYGVSILYTSPTAIRGFMRRGDEGPKRHDLSSLRILGSVGEPINPEAWRWYYEHIGARRCPIVDTWWQTETGGIMIAPQLGLARYALKPGSATLPIAGVDAVVVDEQGRRVPPGERGFLTIQHPWPGEFTTLWGDPERFAQVYFSRFPGVYYAADFAMQDADGYFWLLGRADEVMKVAGHRISTTELEHILLLHPAVAESAVIGRSDAVKFEVPVACIILKPGVPPSSQLREELLLHVRTNMGPIAVPGQIYFVEKLPKTRSAKIMRRLIRDVVEERPLGDVTTLEDETSVEEAKRAYLELKSELERVPK